MGGEGQDLGHPGRQKHVGIFLDETSGHVGGADLIGQVAAAAFLGSKRSIGYPGVRQQAQEIEARLLAAFIGAGVIGRGAAGEQAVVVFFGIGWATRRPWPNPSGCPVGRPRGCRLW